MGVVDPDAFVEEGNLTQVFLLRKARTLTRLNRELGMTPLCRTTPAERR